MIIQIIEVPTKTQLGKPTIHYRVKLQCDQCRVEFVGAAHHTILLKKNVHFCSRNCISIASTGDGIIAIKMKTTSLLRYGVEHHTKCESVEQKRKQTCLERFGEISPMKNSTVTEKRKQRWLHEYGVEHTSKLPETIEKMHATNLVKYGHKSAMGNDEIKKKVNWVKRSQKCHETMKRNGTYRKSKPEDRLYAVLCQFYGPHDIERQVHVPGTPKQWSFDFLIRSTGTYVQLDGVYWHGLDRPLEEHRQSTNLRSSSIVKKWETDRAQEKWFVDHKLHLLRITDDAIMLWSSEQTLHAIAYFNSATPCSISM